MTPGKISVLYDFSVTLVGHICYIFLFQKPPKITFSCTSAWSQCDQLDFMVVSVRTLHMENLFLMTMVLGIRKIVTIHVWLFPIKSSNIFQNYVICIFHVKGLWRPSLLSLIKLARTRDLFKKTGNSKGTFHARIGMINCKDLKEGEETEKRWQEYTEELYRIGPDDPE